MPKKAAKKCYLSNLMRFVASKFVKHFITSTLIINLTALESVPSRAYRADWLYVLTIVITDFLHSLFLTHFRDTQETGLQIPQSGELDKGLGGKSISLRKITFQQRINIEFLNRLVY